MTAPDLRALAEAATPGPWFWNSYSAVFSAPLIGPHEAWIETLPDEDHPENYRGSGFSRMEYEEDFRLDPVVCATRAHHGDTAVGRQAADAAYIAAASPDVILALLDEIDALRDVAETALFPAVIPRMRKAPAQLDGTPGPS